MRAQGPPEMLVVIILFSALVIITPYLAKRLGRRVFWLISLLPLAAFAHALTKLPSVLAGIYPTEHYSWIPELSLNLSLRMDMLSLVLALVVTGIGALVLLYSAWYFHDDEPRLGRFAALLLGFAGTMYALVISDDIMMMFIFWEMTTILSYLLIGHYSDKKETRGAAIQALLVTTFGGLAMLVGIVILVQLSGTTVFSEILANPPESSPALIVSMALIMTGAFSKAALLPFHFWLPAAMAAPTPVSAYLHAAAMVKAGIYLIARLAPVFVATPGWRQTLVVVGAGTMLVGAWRAMRQFDLKLVLAYGTISQLGFMTLIFGWGSETATIAGFALLLAHALYKATLFMVVGIIDHNAGTRDTRQLSGIGKKEPLLAVVAGVALASMMGLPPLVGFIAKEAALTGLLEPAQSGSTWALIALIAVIIGSAMTVAYALRFYYGAFFRKPELDTETAWHKSSFGFLLPPILLTIGSIGFGVLSGWLSALFESYTADAAISIRLKTAAATSGYHLALWHGFEPALQLSILAILLGALLFVFRKKVAVFQAKIPHLIDTAGAYWAMMRGLNHGSAKLINKAQHSGLPGYLSTILLLFACFGLFAIGSGALKPDSLVLWDYPMQTIIALIMIIAAIAAATSTKRMTAVILTGITGYGMVTLFALAGAPDLALTQALVESVTLVVFVLVLRRLPTNMSERNKSSRKLFRLILSATVGITMMLVAIIGLGARQDPTIANELPNLAVNQGHGHNVVNVMLVDIRAWDTMGEISVLVVVATGIASLLFISGRTGQAPRIKGSSQLRSSRDRIRTVVEPATKSITMASPQKLRQLAEEDEIEVRQSWLLAGRTLSAKNRSILLEIIVRLLFHPTMIFSVYLLLVGHNQPGGGFAGGLVAGLALVGRYLAAGRYELGEAAPVDAGKLLGFGIVLAVGTAVSSLIIGKAALSSTWFEFELPLLGNIVFGTPTIFDIGVYLVVIGLVLDILRSLGAEIDRQTEDAESHADDELLIPNVSSEFRDTSLEELILPVRKVSSQDEQEQN